MFLVQWLMRHKVDVRIIIGLGFLICAGSLYQMTGFYLQMDQSMVLWPGVLQGWVPAWSMFPWRGDFYHSGSDLRNEGTAIFSLVRTLGSSIGISVVTTMLTRNTQVMHSRLAENITPYFDRGIPESQRQPRARRW